MIPPTSIDGTDITGATIDGTEVTEITVDGQTVFVSVSAPAPLTGADVYWPMDEGSGTTVSDLNGNQNATFTTNTWGTGSGTPGESTTYAEGGTDDIIESDNEFWTDEQNVSFGVWTYIESAGKTFGSAAKVPEDPNVDPDDVTQTQATINRLDLNLRAGGSNNFLLTSSLPLNEWILIAVTLDGTTARLLAYDSAGIRINQTRSDPRPSDRGLGFRVGSLQSGNILPERVGPCFMARRTLTVSDITTFYNNTQNY